MQTRQGNSVQSLRAVQAFLDEHTASFPSIAASGARKKLDDAVAELTGHATDQRGSIMTGQTSAKRTRAFRSGLLREHMAPITRIARAELPHTHELVPVRSPRGTPTTERVAVAARGMAQAAAPHAAVFVAAGMPVDFLARLEAATEAMLRSVDERIKYEARTAGATRGFGTTLRVARQAVSILDAFVRVALTDDPALLANWIRVKRVRQPRVRTTPAVLASTSAPTPTISVPVTASGAPTDAVIVAAIATPVAAPLLTAAPVAAAA